MLYYEHWSVIRRYTHKFLVYRVPFLQSLIFLYSLLHLLQSFIPSGTGNFIQDFRCAKWSQLWTWAFYHTVMASMQASLSHCRKSQAAPALRCLQKQSTIWIKNILQICMPEHCILNWAWYMQNFVPPITNRSKPGSSRMPKHAFPCPCHKHKSTRI